MRETLLPLLCLAVIGCGKTVDPSEVVVQFDAEPGLRAEIDSLEVTVLGSDGRADSERQERESRVFTGADLQWPLSMSIIPLDDDASRIFEAVGEAKAGGTRVGLVRVITGFVPRQTRFVQLVFYESCRDRTCAAEETCRPSGCEPATIQIASLLDTPPEPVGDGGDGDGDGSCPPTVLGVGRLDEACLQ